MTELRLRFAPSPTGYLHIGGARTALFNWLLARHQKGKFILRIEDTDRERSTQEYVDSIMEGMEWLGLTWDEGPYHQVDRYNLYQEHIDRLLKEGKAYKCFCTKEELDKKREQMQQAGAKPKYDGRCRNADQSQDKPYCIRFLSTDEGTTAIQDEIRGEVVFDNKELDDLIIRRTDGTPTYNLVVVVDDVTMRINDVIRGDDHLNNTPRQVQLYDAFDYPVPKFAHLPMILGPDKKRLSKRHGATSVLAYRDQGYLPEALLNFLARLGWSAGDQEIFTVGELIEKFSMEHVGKAAGVFNAEKLLWTNFEHMRQMPHKELLERTQPFFKKVGIELTIDDYAGRAIASVKEKAKTLEELVGHAVFYFVDLPEYEEKAAAKFLNEEGRAMLGELTQRLSVLDAFTEEALKATVDDFLQEKELKLKAVAQPLRVALCGTTVSPGIYETMVILGKDRVIKRLQHVLAK
jgi:glutamyl-tRNA synthetase